MHKKIVFLLVLSISALLDHNLVAMRRTVNRLPPFRLLRDLHRYFSVTTTVKQPKPDKQQEPKETHDKQRGTFGDGMFFGAFGTGSFGAVLVAGFNYLDEYETPEVQRERDEAALRFRSFFLRKYYELVALKNEADYSNRQLGLSTYEKKLKEFQEILRVVDQKLLYRSIDRFIAYQSNNPEEKIKFCDENFFQLLKTIQEENE